VEVKSIKLAKLASLMLSSMLQTLGPCYLRLESPSCLLWKEIRVPVQGTLL
jgi:hypothetical protein